ncbi:MAG: helix-turn-helix domain-containing protein [Candidatus Nanopelagicaceae bacterium]|nr:helix-turn-helix domain-containing protein [Candidatus Nanopelagicaceae bacterium]
MNLRDIAKEISCSHSGIDVMLYELEQAPQPDAWIPRLGHLTASDRKEILPGLQRGESTSVIARDLDRSPSTVSRGIDVPLRWLHLRDRRSEQTAY